MKEMNKDYEKLRRTLIKLSANYPLEDEIRILDELYSEWEQMVEAPRAAGQAAQEVAGMSDDLPPLPLGEYMGSCNGVPSHRYTAEHMRAYARAAIAKRDAEIVRLIRELESHRIYARVLCKAVDAAIDFAGTVAGGASWWDDVWADHDEALDKYKPLLDKN